MDLKIEARLILELTVSISTKSHMEVLPAVKGEEELRILFCLSFSSIDDSFSYRFASYLYDKRGWEVKFSELSHVLHNKLVLKP